MSTRHEPPAAAGTDRTWIFAYGSLVSPASLGATIGRDVTLAHDVVAAELHGYRRAWNYGSAVLRGDWSTPDGGEVVGGLVVSLGLVAEEGATANGVVFAVGADELADLDWRERAYDRVDVTDAVVLDLRDVGDGAARRVGDPHGGASGRRIVTYVPRSSSIERYREHRDAGTAAVRRNYVELVERAFDELGPDHGERYRTTTPEPDVPIADVRIDPLPSPRPRPS
ncbi:gamma-glutamylcyclotransferase family protein [Ilumatobacter sp.]|uniref:gamma-glutamylcyclotransferase family protein n=1 Tax=Ilumatobacter sp. TaxID=1967498 RepID=UPI003B52917B